jgi:hypothetical protein
MLGNWGRGKGKARMKWNEAWRKTKRNRGSLARQHESCQNLKGVAWKKQRENSSKMTKLKKNLAGIQSEFF